MRPRRESRPAGRTEDIAGRVPVDPKQIRRFEREARAAARLHHTNIVPVFGVGKSPRELILW